MTEGKSKAYIAHTGNGYAISLLGSNEILKSGDYNILTDQELSKLHQRIKDLEAEREQAVSYGFQYCARFPELSPSQYKREHENCIKEYWQQQQKEQDDKR